MSTATRWSQGPVGTSKPGARRARRVVPVLALLLVLIFGAITGCADDSPPDITLAALGAAVGEAKLDDLDFSALLATYTSEDYGAGVQPEQVNYQLYLTAKAADLGLNKAGPGTIEVTKQIDGRSATFRFAIAQKEGLFAVADVGSVDITLVRTDAAEYPWRIEAITLSR
ncbi:MAG: hypothetical protein ACYCX3_11895 [Thermoleophilia bacterium]